VRSSCRLFQLLANDGLLNLNPGALPKIFTPKQCPFGLYAEQLSGTAFTAPRHSNQRTWLYRIKPAAQHSPYKAYNGNKLLVSDFAKGIIDPNRIR
jgi:homogentisate 1,2-dioxygenase